MSDSPKKNPLVPPFQFNDWSTPQTTSVRMPPFDGDSVQATTGHMRKIIDDLTAERDAALIESSALKAEVERLRAGWISVTDRMPDTDDEVLAYVPKSMFQKIQIERWMMRRESPISFSSATIEIGYWWDNNDHEDVTHWMPMPEPPAAIKEQSND